MKKFNLLFFIFLIVSGVNVFSQSVYSPTSEKEFKASGLEDSVKKHKIIAILPFNANITYKVKSKYYDSASNRLEEERLRTQMQDGMYTFLLNKADDYSVSFQDVSKTNILLKKANLYDKLNETLPDIAKVLGVDAIVQSRYDYVKKKSEGADVAEAYLLGWAASRTASGSLVMQIYSGTNGSLLYRFYKELGEDITSNPNEIMDRMMKKVAYYFPYKIKK